MRRTRVIGLPGLNENFEAIYLDDQGVEQRVPWAWLPEVVDELERPVRSFPSYRGQRNFPGWYWSATMGRRVGFESWVERDHLVALDFDPSVTRVVSQPFWLLWPGEGKTRRHAPDFLVRLDDGTVLVLDSRPLELVEDVDRQAFTVTDQACGLLSWRYAVWDRLPASALLRRAGRRATAGGVRTAASVDGRRRGRRGSAGHSAGALSPALAA